MSCCPLVSVGDHIKSFRIATITARLGKRQPTVFMKELFHKYSGLFCRCAGLKQSA